MLTLTCKGMTDYMVGHPYDLNVHILNEYDHLTRDLPSVKDYKDGFKFKVEWVHKGKTYSDEYEVKTSTEEDIIWLRAYHTGVA